MAIYTFGAGTLWGTRTDIANATPIKFGDVQEVTVEFSSTSKTLMGQNLFPIATALASAKITGKAKLARIQGSIFSDLFFGLARTTGQITTANGETATIPATPYQVTVANAATFVADLGVINATTALPLTKVAAAPTTGQYSVSGVGVYTFAAADTGNSLQISYKYSITTAGQTIAITNQLQGVAPFWRADLETLWNGPKGLKKAVLTLNACQSSKLSAGTKQGDWQQPELDFEAVDDGTGNIGAWSFNENS